MPGNGALRYGCAALFVSLAAGQTLDNRSLSGKYYFRHLLLTTDASGNATDVRSALGSMTFDESGAFTFSGQQNVGAAAAAAFSGSGTYTVSPAGVATLTNPQRSDLSLNARLATAALIGSTTETPENVFDFFIAVPAPTAASSWDGVFHASDFELPGAAMGNVRNAHFLLRPNSAGGLLEMTVHGHAASRGHQPFTETLQPGSYTLSADGIGSITLPASNLVASNKTIYFSRDGNTVIGGSTAAGAHDVFVAIRSLPEAATTQTWKERFWAAGIRVDGKTASAFAASSNASSGRLTWSQRGRQLAEPAIDYTGVAPYNLLSDGTGRALAAWIGVGAGGDAFLGSTVAPEVAETYELYFGYRMPTVAGTGVFLNPQGIVNTASFAPAGAPISPGQFVGLFGSGLAPRTETAQTSTFPTTLAGVQVLINNVAAPLYFVSAGQISAIVPFGTTGSRATIMVDNNGTRSNTVDVPLAATAPGVFSLSQSGAGAGAILKSNFSVVSGSNPARRGDSILIFLTGLGAVSPAVPDGAPGPVSPLSNTTQRPVVRIGGAAATVTYSGLAPGFSGLYQLNVIVPNTAPFGQAVPVSIETTQHFHDQVDVVIEP